jgi:tetratricopeptide (TPR) repeat protein
VIKLYLGRGSVSKTLGNFEGALADYEAALRLTGSAGEGSFKFLRWRALINLGRLWASRDYHRAHDCLGDALGLALRMDDPQVLAESLNWMGNWYGNQEDPLAAVEHHERALEIFEQVGDRPGLAATLDLLGLASVLGGDLIASVGYYDRAITLFRELDDQPHLGSSLTGRGHASGATFTSLTAISPARPISPRRDFEEAIRIAQETGSLADEAWLDWSLGRMHTVQGRYGQALEVIKRGHDIATQIGHREWIVGNQCAMGVLYLELLAPERAQRELDAALALARELRSEFWIRWATGALAGAYCLLDDGTRAQMLLEPVLSAGTPMDAEAKRHCWARWAELALAQGDPALALDIVERLISSAPGMAPGRVITYLWKLKGEALIALGDWEEARSLLQAAVRNAQATGEQFLLWHLHTRLGLLYGALRRQSEAEREFSTTSELIQELADTVPDGELRDNFFRRAHERLRTWS